MSDSTDLAGVIGTWVAVGLALIALVGVVGPILVWRASRTDRHQALDAVARYSPGSVTRGIAVWPGIRFRREFRAPLLSQPLREDDMRATIVFWKRDSEPEPQESPDWAKFARLLSAYGIRHQTGNQVIVDGKTARLHVHRSWVLILGLLSGCAHRPEKGKANFEIRPNQTIRGSSGKIWRNTSGPPATSKLPLSQWFPGRSVEDGHVYYASFCGLTFTILLPIPTPRDYYGRRESPNGPASDKVHIEVFTQAEVGLLPKYEISLNEIFGLSIGFLPLPNQQFFHLGDSHERILRPRIRDLPPPDPERLIVYQTPANFRGKLPDSSTESDVEDHNSSPPMCRVFEFGATPEGIFPQGFIPQQYPFAETANKTSFLKEFSPSEEVTTKLNTFGRVTWVPAESDYIRLDPASADIQQSALGLQEPAMEPLLRTLSAVLNVASNLQKTREIYSALFDLHEAIRPHLHTDIHINAAIGVLFLTNPEFQSIIRHAAAHLDSGVASSIHVDFQAKKILLKAAFDIPQRFPIDFDVLFPGEDLGGATVSVSFKFVWMAALQAAVKSTMLSTSLDSRPFITTLLELPEILTLS